MLKVVARSLFSLWTVNTSICLATLEFVMISAVAMLTIRPRGLPRD